MITHARTETLAEQRFFADALARQRGVLPATGFYEWRGQAQTRKQPYWLSRKGELLYMAALWEPYAVVGQEYLSAALLTVQAAYLRRPLLLAETELAEWMDPATPMERIQALLNGGGLALQERKVSTLVNDPQQDGSECIRPICFCRYTAGLRYGPAGSRTENGRPSWQNWRKRGHADRVCC